MAAGLNTYTNSAQLTTSTLNNSKNDNTVEYRAVTLGRMVDGLRAVQSGLRAGEQVVINGLMRVRPGMKVAAKSAPMVAAAAAPTRPAR